MGDISNEEKVARHTAVKNAGFDGSDWPLWHRKYRNLRDRVPSLGLECLLTFTQYMKLAKRAGLSSPDNIGRSTHQYAMGRLGDTGNYVWGNCRFITVEQNLKERKKNGGNVSISETQQGRTANTHASVARVAAQNRGRTAETHDSVARSAEKRSASFIVTSPDGKRYKGRNVSAFCRAHGLHQGRLSRVLSGARNHYSGWTGYYTD